MAIKKVLMVSPTNFGFNPETAINNEFQRNDTTLTADEIKQMALAEWNGLKMLLMENGIEVLTLENPPEPVTPDAVFPNNWFSTHEDGTVILYPMFAPNRRLERVPELLKGVLEKGNFKVTKVDESLLKFENENEFLEGTGSLILDRLNKIAYACLAPRTTEKVLSEWSKLTGYKVVSFKAFGENLKTPIYHTNVMMAVGEKFAVICMESIKDPVERNNLFYHFRNIGKEIVEISFEQMNSFAGNCLELENKKGERFLVMSQRANDSLNNHQRELLAPYVKVISTSVNTIERFGGGSVRCMLAEIASSGEA